MLKQRESGNKNLRIFNLQIYKSISNEQIIKWLYFVILKHQPKNLSLDPSVASGDLRVTLM